MRRRNRRRWVAKAAVAAASNPTSVRLKKREGARDRPLLLLVRGDVRRGKRSRAVQETRERRERRIGYVVFDTFGVQFGRV
jgi:hypothetical protein